MLHPLNVKIDFAESPAYARLALFIYLFTLLIVFTAAFAWFVKAAISLLLLYQLIELIKRPRPNPNYSSLNYVNETWLLQTTTNQQLSFTRIRVILDIELFFLLELKEGQRKKRLVIFPDQLSNCCYRSLRIIEKTQ